jgi:intraflagellar transport protein 122
MGDNKWLDPLIRAARSLDKNKNRPELEQCAYYFTKHKHHEYASEVYTILGEWEKLVKLHVQMEKWEDAFRVLDTHPEFNELVYLPYAEFLVLNDRFDEALEAYKKAKQPVMALSMIEQLACSAVIEQRFNDASYYFWRLSIECLNIISDERGLF